MFVYEKMIKNIENIIPSFSVSKAFQILKEKEYSELPVVDKDNKLVGIISEKILAEVSPASATSLSVYEINYLLNQTKVSDIMKTGIFKINQNRPIEESALIMKENRIDSLTVINDENIVVGIITMKDIFKAFIDIMGIKASGTTLFIESKENNDLIEIINIISKNNLELNYISNYNIKDRKEIVLKLNTLEVGNIIKELKEKQYNIIFINKQY